MNYLGGKKTSLSEIPAGWEMEELNNILMIIKDKYTPDKKEDICCLELEHFEQRTGIINGWCSSSTQASVKNAFKKGQVLFGKLRPYLQKYWLADFDGVCSSEVWVLTSKDKKALDNRYLFRMVQMHRFIQAANVSFGSKMPRSDWEYMANIPFPLPPLPEQKRIATILSTWDKAIAKEQQLIKILEIRHRALMQQLLSGKKRMKGFKGEWRKVSYGSLLKEVKRPVSWSDDELYNLISVRRRSGGIFLREALFGFQIKVKDLRNVCVNDFLFSKMQIVHGASALVTEKFENTKISGSYIAVVAKKPTELNIQFFNWCSRLPYFYHQTYVSSFGVHIEKMTFDFEAFLSLEMALPSLDEQVAITKILNSSDNEIQIHRRRLEAWQQQKKGLMQVLLTGKVRVKI